MMRVLPFTLGLLGVLAAHHPTLAQATADATSRTHSLFNGKDLRGWKQLNGRE